MEYGKGENPRAESVNYGDDMRLNPKKGTVEDVKWYGIRYEIPMSVFNHDFMNIDLVCFSVGMMSKKLSIKSNMWEIDEELVTVSDAKTYEAASVNGPYIGVNARWRLDSAAAKEDDPWFGAYGLDVGARYVRFSEGTAKYNTYSAPKSNLNSYQIFIILFVKVRLLY